jgi:hypothetical protein
LFVKVPRCLEILPDEAVKAAVLVRSDVLLLLE